MKKLHKWRRAVHPQRFKTPKTYDNFWFICDEPDCNVKKRFEDIMNKYAACHSCGTKFVVTENDWKYYTLKCPACIAGINIKIDLGEINERTPTVRERFFDTEA